MTIHIILGFPINGGPVQVIYAHVNEYYVRDELMKIMSENKWTGVTIHKHTTSEGYE